MKSHINIPIFIPHLGCPNTCVFCNQRKISGHVSFDMNSVRRDIDTALETIKPGQKCQIAYFGGSFTGIPREDMIELLTIAKSYIDRGLVDSIRLSTRPDYIDEEILNILKQYGVTSIELGLQSMRDTVLTSCKRGHTALDGINACKLIKKYGFELIGQMMTGLPGSSIDDEIYTAKSICEVGADGARIYPTVVFIDTELCDMAKSGSYNMPTEEDLINRTVAALKVFIDNNVNVIRIGLQSSEAVLDDDQTYSNSYH
ncbi:MAG: radical SAM protein, partial [Clostridia bacterium]|nr:radical SAM protein [Clostridia bacterium]